MSAITSLREHQLDNGLRVVVASTPVARRVGVCLSYSIGYRADPPSLSGFAHLIEHLMYQSGGGELEPDYFRFVSTHGGAANALTLADTTEFYSIIPYPCLDELLAREAKRMSSATITADAVADSLLGIESEISARNRRGPLADMPWPGLSRLFADWPNGHDGLGVVSELAEATHLQCEEFYSEHYVPNGAALAIVGNLNPREVIEAVRRNFSHLDATFSRSAPTSRVTTWSGDVLAVEAREGLSGDYRYTATLMPDTGGDPIGYDSSVLLAQVLLGIGDRLGMGGQLTSSAGLFGPWHIGAPDLFIVSAAFQDDKTDFLSDASAYIESLASLSKRSSFIDLVESARLNFVKDSGQDLVHPMQLARLLARSWNVCDQPDALLSRYLGIQSVAVEDVAQAADTMSKSAHAHVYVLASQNSGRLIDMGGFRPTGKFDQSPPIRTLTQLPSDPSSVQKCFEGIPVSNVGDVRPSGRESTLLEFTSEGYRAIALSDARSRHIEIRASFTFSPKWLMHPQLPRLAVRRLQEDGKFRARFSYDGEKLTASDTLGPGELRGWVERVKSSLKLLTLDGVMSVDAVGPRPDSASLADDVIRGLMLRDTDLTLDRDTEAIFLDTVLIVLVGDTVDLDPDVFAPFMVAPAGPRAAYPIVREGNILQASIPGVEGMSLLYATQPARNILARQVVATMISGWPGSILANVGPELVPGGYSVDAGYDRVLGLDRMYIRAWGPLPGASSVAQEVLERIQTSDTLPNFRRFIVETREVCALGSLSMFDSLGAIADALLSYSHWGFSAEDILDMHSNFLTVPEDLIAFEFRQYPRAAQSQLTGEG